MKCSSDPACVFPAVSRAGRCAHHERDFIEAEARSMTVATVNAIYVMGESVTQRWRNQRSSKAKKLTKNQLGESELSKRAKI
jgi:hypothetical protein